MSQLKISRKKRGRPTLQKELNKESVIDVAIKIFALHGYEGTQLKEIAQQANINNSLINYHFDGKIDIWKQAIFKLSLKLTNRFLEIQNYFKDLEGDLLIKAYIRQYIYFISENPEFQRIILFEVGSQSDRSDWLIQTILNPMQNMGEKLILNGSNNSKISFPNLLSIIIGSCSTFFLHSYQLKKQYGINTFEKEEIEKHADFVIDLIFEKNSFA